MCSRSISNTGIIVWAFQIRKTNADISAGFRSYSTKEAWINVANVDIEGTSFNGKTYTLQSVPWRTAEYCLSADGLEYYHGGNDYLVGVFTMNRNWYLICCSSISGVIALLATHFPNHSRTIDW